MQEFHSRENFKILYLRAPVLITLFIFACTDIEDVVLENELDPENPSYVEPQTIIKPVSQDNFVKNSFVIEWEGIIANMEFSYKRDQQKWSNWTIQTYTTLNYLDEGPHTFFVKGRYLSGYQEAIPDSISFTTNAVTGPALRVAPLYKETVNGDLFNVDLMAEDLSNVAGAEVLLLFDATVLAYQRVESGEFFARAQGDVLELSKLKSANLVQINIGAYNGTYRSASGSGVIARVYFKSIKAGQSTLIIQQGSTLRDKDNKTLTLNSLVNGIVVVN